MNEEIKAVADRLIGLREIMDVSVERLQKFVEYLKNNIKLMNLEILIFQLAFYSQCQKNTE